jgi:LuxR family quorum-sensing system transcriptional regulator CciR
MRISDFIEASNRTDSPGGLLPLMERAVSEIGFERYAYCALTSHDRYKGADNRAPAVALNYPASWTDYYFEHGYQLTDPVLHYARGIAHPFLWHWLEQSVKLNGAQAMVMDQAREAGLLDGAAVPIHGPYGNVCLFTCASANRHPRAGMMLPNLAVLATQFHAAYSDLCRIEADCRIVPVLSERERACLQWVARGKSSSDVGEILHISENTVNFHLRKAFSKLGASNRIAAVVNAIRYGLISL